MSASGSGGRPARTSVSQAVNGLRAAHASTQIPPITTTVRPTPVGTGVNLTDQPTRPPGAPMDLDQILNSIDDSVAGRQPFQFASRRSTPVTPDARTARENGSIPPTRLGPPSGRARATSPERTDRAVRSRNQRHGSGSSRQRSHPYSRTNGSTDAESEQAPWSGSPSGRGSGGGGRSRGGRRSANGARVRRRGSADESLEGDAEEDDNEGEAEEDGDGARRDRSTVDSTRAHPPPSLAYVEAYLGHPNPDRSKCWFCRSGRTNSAAISFKAWNQLMTMYRRSRVDTDPIVLAMEMHIFFERYIRRPANKHRRPGQEEIPEQRAIDIYAHCRKHIKEASNRLIQRIEELQEAGDTIYDHCLYKPIRNVRGEVRLVVRKKYLDAYLKVVKEERMLRNSRPERMFLFSNDYCLDTGDVRGFMNINRPFQMDNLPSYLLGGGDPNTRRAVKNSS